jgi:hypothetical protein
MSINLGDSYQIIVLLGSVSRDKPVIGFMEYGHGILLLPLLVCSFVALSALRCSAAFSGRSTCGVLCYGKHKDRDAEQEPYIAYLAAFARVLMFSGQIVRHATDWRFGLSDSP